MDPLAVTWSARRCVKIPGVRIKLSLGHADVRTGALEQPRIKVSSRESTPGVTKIRSLQL